MNYKKNYYDYINYVLSLHREKDNNIKYEKHHIIPKSLGGLNNKDNLILLTSREHFLAHYLLTKFIADKEDRSKMLKALWVLSYIKKEKVFIISSKQFAKLRKEVIDNKCIPVICLETMEIFPSMKIASKTVGGRVDSFFKGRTKSAGGYSNWEFYNPTKVYTKKVSDYNYADRPSLKKKVICLDTREVFESIKEAADKYSLSASKISAICLGKIYQIKGLHFSFYSENIDIEYTLSKMVEKNKAIYENKRRRVICIETEEIFESIKEAAIWAKVSAARISGCCRNVPDCKSAGGYHWKYRTN